MTPDKLNLLISALDAQGVVFVKGLSDPEITAIEATFGLCFPEDLKAFLQAALPVSPSFVNWRAALKSPQIALDRLSMPLKDLLFDVRKNSFWLNIWGEKPSLSAEQAHVVTAHYARYPKLIPIYSHRFIPSTPSSAGNPVFSMMGTDIIYYGTNLYNYLINEFYLSLEKENNLTKTIPFWSQLVELNT